MSDAQLYKKDDVETPTADSMAAFSNQLDNLKDALDLLYIPYNASGRNKFRDKLPSIAQYIFGEELIKYDNEGATDPDHRIKLENDADERRIGLKITISEIVEKSVDSGSLIFDYVGQVIDQYGAEVSQFLYADDIIERVRPNLLASIEVKATPESEEIVTEEISIQPDASTNEQQEQKPSEEEAPILSNAPAEEVIPAPISTPEIEDTPINEPEEISEPTTKKIIYKDIFNLVATGK